MKRKKWGLVQLMVHAMPCLQTMNHHKVLGAKQTSVCEVHDVESLAYSRLPAIHIWDLWGQLQPPEEGTPSSNCFQ